MEYVKGEKVKHPKQDAWGLGVVLENPNDDKVRIFSNMLEKSSFRQNLFSRLRWRENRLKV